MRQNLSQYSFTRLLGTIITLMKYCDKNIIQEELPLNHFDGTNSIQQINITIKNCDHFHIL